MQVENSIGPVGRVFDDCVKVYHSEEPSQRWCWLRIAHEKLHRVPSRHVQKKCGEKFSKSAKRTARRGAKDSKSEHNVKFSPTKHLSIEKRTLIPAITIFLRLLSTSAEETFTTREIREKNSLLTNFGKTQFFIISRCVQLVKTILFKCSVKK